MLPLLMQLSFPTNLVNDIPLVTLIVGVCTVAIYGIKAGRHLWSKWIEWDNNRTQMEIVKVFGQYDKKSLDDIIKNLCDKISKNANNANYESVMRDLNRLKGAISVMTGGKYDV